MLVKTNNLKSFKGEIDKQTKKYLATLDKLKKEVVELNKKKTNLIDEKNQFEVLTKNNKLLKNVNDILESDNEKLNKEIITTDNEIKKNKAYLEELNDKIGDINLELVNKGQELNVIKGNISNKEKESKKLDNINKEIDSLNEIKKGLDKEIVKLEGLIEKRKDKIKGLDDEILSKKNLIKVQDKELILINAMIEERQKEYDSKEKSIKELQNTIDNNNLKITTLTMLKDDLIKSIEDQEVLFNNQLIQIENNKYVIEEQKKELYNLKGKIDLNNIEIKKLDFYKEKIEEYIKKSNLDLII